MRLHSLLVSVIDFGQMVVQSSVFWWVGCKDIIEGPHSRWCIAHNRIQPRIQLLVHVMLPGLCSTDTQNNRALLPSRFIQIKYMRVMIVYYIWVHRTLQRIDFIVASYMRILILLPTPGGNIIYNIYIHSPRVCWKINTKNTGMEISIRVRNQSRICIYPSPIGVPEILYICECCCRQTRIVSLWVVVCRVFILCNSRIR